MGQICLHGLLIACHVTRCMLMRIDHGQLVSSLGWQSDYAYSTCLSQRVALTTGGKLPPAEENNG